MRCILHITLALSASLSLAACGRAEAENTPLKIGMIPDAGATQASITQKQPLQEYLSTAIGQPVEVIIPTSYNATVEALGNGSLDIAYLGGLTFVKAQRRYGAVPLVQRAIDQQFHSVFITIADSEISSLTDLEGKSFCFGDVNSTSGHLIPRAALKQSGLAADALGETRNTGSHPATAQGVASGTCDAGAMDETVYKQLITSGQLEADKIRVFYTSQPFTDYVWAAAKDLSKDKREAFSKAMLTLKRGEDDAVLDILRGDSFVPAKTESYDGVASTARELGLLEDS